MGNVTITPKRKAVMGSRVRQSFDLTFSASYATNGDTIPDTEFAKLFPDLKVIPAAVTFVDFFDAELGPAGHSVYFDRAAKKVKAFNGTTEIANATNLSAVVVRCIAEFGDSPSTGV